MSKVKHSYECGHHIYALWTSYDVSSTKLHHSACPRCLANIKLEKLHKDLAWESRYQEQLKIDLDRVEHEARTFTRSPNCRYASIQERSYYSKVRKAKKDLDKSIAKKKDLEDELAALLSKQ